MKWLWRVFNQGWPDGHEDSTNTWGAWSLISAEDAERLAKEDVLEKRYEFVPYSPSVPSSQSDAGAEPEGGVNPGS